MLELGDNLGDLGDLVLQASAHGFRHLQLVLGVFKFIVDLVDLVVVGGRNTLVMAREIEAIP